MRNWESSMKTQLNAQVWSINFISNYNLHLCQRSWCIRKSLIEASAVDYQHHPRRESMLDPALWILEMVSVRVLGVWLWLLFKVFFTQKSVPIIFFYFLKIIFEISVSKWFENIKNILLQSKKKKNQFFSESLLKSTPKLNYDNSPKFYIALVACDN